MQIKEFPESRICIIDFKPVLSKAIKNAQSFCKKTKIVFNLENKDVKKLLCHFIINDFCNVYANIKTSYIKIFGVYNFEAEKEIKDVVDKVFKVMPIPHCKIQGMDHPDAKYAAINQINKDQRNYERYKKFVNKNELLELEKKATQNTIFLKGTVDLSRFPE